MLLQLSGTGLVSQDGREVLLAPGDCSFADSTRPSVLVFDGEFDQLVVHVPHKIVAAQFGRTERLTALPVRAASPMGTVLNSFLQNAASTIKKVKPATAERLSHIGLGLIVATLGEVASAGKGRSNWTRTALLYRAKEFIEAHASDHALNPDGVAAALQISTRHLQALFRDEDTTPSEWIWCRRIEKSRRDLSDPVAAARNISEIALACGFADFAHFSRRFAAAHGMSPREFRSLRLPKQFAGAAR